MPGDATGRKVVGVGLSVLDYLVLWQDASRPVAGNRIVAFEAQGGGMVGTAMTAVARLGGRAEFWGAVGGDSVGDRIVADLAADGIDTSQVRRVEGAAGPFVVVCVDQPTGERHFLHYTGAIRQDEPLGDLSRLAGAGAVLIDATHPESQRRAAAEAQRLGVPVVGDYSPAGAARAGLLACTDYAIVSEAGLHGPDGAADLRAACEGLRAAGPRCAVVTRGSGGLAFLDGERYGEMPAFDVDVVDTTGAGDVFHGAFCLGLAEGLGVEENLRFASAVAALKCTRLGGRAGIPARSRVDAFLAGR